MSLTVYGEIALDLLVSSESEISSRVGGAGLYASVAAAKQEIKVDFLTIYNSEISDYQIFLWNSMGVSLKYAKKDECYDLPKYLVTGYKNYEKKISRPMSSLKNDYNYSPEIPNDSQGILIFPIGHTIPVSVCKHAKDNDLLVFLDPKPNQKSIDDAKRALEYTDVLLVNEDEAMLLSETESISEAINALSQKNINYVIIKRGPKGCILIDKDKKITEIPSFKSNAVCTLGSGDVFGGAIAATFLETKDINYSIEIASCVAAKFIENFEIEYMLNKAARGIELEKRKKNDISELKEIVAYLAGPFFSEQETNWVNYVKKMLELRNISVLSPMHSNGIVKPDSSYTERKKVFDLDIQLLESANVVIALLDHNDVGTSFEIGYAYKNNLPVIGYKTSASPPNNMIYCGCDKIVDTIESLIEEVREHVK